MKTYKHLIFSFALSLITFALSAQQRIAGKSFVKEHTVYLRFVPSDYAAFNQCKQDGFIIKRIAWESTALPDSSKFKDASAIEIKCLKKENPKWDSLAKQDEASGFLYNMLYKPVSNPKTDMNMAYGLVMISCDFNVDLAKAAGLFYSDKNIVAGKYAYLIQPKNPKVAKTIQPAILLINADKDDALQNIDSLKIKTRRKEVKLVWNAKRLIADYSGYFIERSEDGKQFSVLNKKPHVQVQTQYEKDKKEISYNDTITTYGKTYYYRVRGLGFFGTYGNYSEVVTCRLIKPMDAFPLADSTHLLNDTMLTVHWHMPSKFDLNELAGFDILRAEEMEGKYIKMNKTKLPKETNLFKDLKPKSSNYYKVLAYSIYGDSAYSHPMMGLIPDKTPPLVPIGLKGKVDSTGKVTLSWKPNKEKDLKGYRIFRNNAANEELVEVTKVILTDTLFKDTLNLKTLSEDVFYSITAVDQVYNNSPFAKPLKLKRPDKIKPVEAQLFQPIHNDTSIVVKWIPSTSKDVASYELWKNATGEAPQKIKEWKSTDTIREYRDANLKYATYYQYQIKVTDDDGNFSMSSTKPHYFDSRIRKPIKKISYKVDLENKSILLKWEYPEKELYSFVIYKAKAGEPMKIIKTVKATVFNFEDKELFIGNKYVYKIKAIYNSGAESKISDEINVTF